MIDRENVSVLRQKYKIVEEATKSSSERTPGYSKSRLLLVALRRGSQRDHVGSTNQLEGISSDRNEIEDISEIEALLNR
jgi:hypothetical protein